MVILKFDLKTSFLRGRRKSLNYVPHLVNSILFGFGLVQVDMGTMRNKMVGLGGLGSPMGVENMGHIPMNLFQALNISNTRSRHLDQDTS